MNRQIKFRAWDNVDFMTKPFTLEEVVMGSVRFTDKDSTLMQYTGLKDKNGKEIYEGDVVATLRGNRIVIYDEPAFFLAKSLLGYLEVDWFSTPTIDEEVIGNIYENPELLDNDKVIK